jgi:hypothetical protein
MGLAVAAFVLVAGSMTLWFRRIQRVDIPRDRRAFVACWLAGALLGVVALIQGPGWVGGTLAGIAIAAGALFSTLVYISPQKVAGHAIQVGERLRDFTALDEHGDEFSTADVAGKPVLLKFFRGHW